jgi:hypothetical protein
MAKPRAGSVQQLRSLNRHARDREVQRITWENEQLLKRLQQAPATYNIFDWESQRKDQIKQIKNICYYPPSLLKKKRRKSRKRDSSVEPNKQLFDLY